MGHGKESPRQKMIGMMYLFLTALLALNVSKEVLNAFILIDDGLTKTIKNYSAKNGSIYTAFENAAMENPAKAEKWKNKAFKVKEETNKMFKIIQDYKLMIVAATGQEESTYLNEHKELVSSKISAKDDSNIPAMVMIQQGEGANLKAEFQKYKDYILSVVGGNESLIKSINSNIFLEAQEDSHGSGHDGPPPTWEIDNFEHLPMIAVVTNMTKMQSDIRNVEADILTFLYKNIDAGSFKFNKLGANIIANSNYIQQGSGYEAQVFLAAYDTTSFPTIYIGTYDTITKKMKGTLGVDYNRLEIDSLTGKGKYVGNGSSLGVKKWGGAIFIANPAIEGDTLVYPFTQEYQVAKSGVVVSPIKMNVLYRGIDNPIAVSAGGVPEDKVSAYMSNQAGWKRGKKKGEFLAKPGKGKECIISVQAEIDGKKRTIGTQKFRVKNIPPPVAKVAGLTDGKVKKSVLKAQKVVMAQLDNFAFDLKYKVTKFEMNVKIGGYDKVLKSNSRRLTPEMIASLAKVKRKQSVSFTSIRAKGPDGVQRKLSPVVLTVK